MVDIHNNIDFDWIYNSVTHYAAGDGSKKIKINVFVCNNAKQFFEE
jgi:hypothetical protein